MSEDGSENEKPKEPEPEADGKRIFLAHANTYEGQAMFKELWNKDKVREPEKAAHTFVGTVRKEERNARDGYQEPPEGIEKFIEFERTEEFRQSLLQSNVIIYDLMSNNYEEIDYVIKTLKTSDLQEEKTLVLLSSVMTWVNTPAKFEEELVEGQEEGEGEEPAEEEESDAGEDYLAEKEKPVEEDEEAEPELGEDGEPVVIKKSINFKETDFHLRVPHANFQHLKTLETIAMSSVNTQPKLRVHILCSGIRYGNGERIFYDHFQKAWIQNPNELPYIGEGENLVPTIHIIDLARLVRRIVIEDPKEYPYIFAIDKTRRPSHKRLVQAISKGMGTDKVASVDEASIENKQGWKQFLTINLKMRASDVFKSLPINEEELPEFDDNNPKAEEEYRASFDFPWHSRYGIIGNIKNLNVEFNTFKGLNPVKIFVTGPPASGKTFYSDELAKYYNIPKVNVKQLLDEVWRMVGIDEEALGDEPDPLLVEVRAKVEELREAEVGKIDEKRADLPEPEDGWPEVDRESLTIRIPDRLLYKLLRIRLAANACRNRGYILDGYPRTYDDACWSYLDKIPKYDEETGDLIEDDEEEELPEDDENYVKKDFSTGFEKAAAIFPSSCIVLEGSDEELINRVRELPEEKLVGTHYTKEGMVRRLTTYRTANNSVVAEPSVQYFFKKQTVSV